MPYTLNFSDPANLNTVTVPDYPPGLNTVDTSLSFVGKNYPNYGQVIDQNFLKLLENFSSPVSPNHPIKGQIWYDSFNRTLKLFDGNVWKSANGIYQQATDPSLSSPVSYGDIWVDTSINILKIRGAGEWVQVGPSISEGTGIEVKVLDDAANVGAQHTVLFVKVNGVVVAVYNNDTEFTPGTYPSELQNVTTIAKGITIPDTGLDNNYVIKGTADDASKLNGIAGSSYLRKNDSSAGGQVITGKVIFQTPASAGGENRDGIVIRIDGDNPALDYIQFFKKDNDAIISNQVKSGKIIFKVKGLNETNQTDVLTLEKNSVLIQGNLNLSTGTISASSFNGTVSYSTQTGITSLGTLTNLVVDGTIISSGVVTAGGIETSGTMIVSNLVVTNQATIQGIYTTGTVKLHVGSTSTGIPSGWLVCDGSQISTATYKALYNLIGDDYGISAGGLFYLPNMVMTSPLPPGDPRGANTATYYIIKQD